MIFIVKNVQKVTVERVDILQKQIIYLEKLDINLYNTNTRKKNMFTANSE